MQVWDSEEAQKGDRNLEIQDVWSPLPHPKNDDRPATGKLAKGLCPQQTPRQEMT